MATPAKPDPRQAHGVAHVWLVDPNEKTLEVHAPAERQVRLYQGDARVRVDPFAAIELDLSALCSAPRTP